MKYLKYFDEASAYEAYKNGSDYVLPNVSYVVEGNTVNYNPEPPFKIEIPSPYTEWARIQHKDGTLYTAEEWLAAKTAGTVVNEDANGVAVLYSKLAICPHVMHPNYGSALWSKDYVEIPGVTTVTDSSAAGIDVNGKANTDAIISALSSGIVNDAPAAQYCVDTIFADGHTGYLPAAGEVLAWTNNASAINACMNAIGGKRVKDRQAWSSTQYSNENAWFATSGSDYVHQYYDVYLSQEGKAKHNVQKDVRPAISFEYNPKNEYSNKN